MCTPSLALLLRLQDEFAKRNTKVIAVSVDPIDSQ